MNYMHERHVVSASALPGRPALAAREGLIAALQRYAEEKSAGFFLYPHAEGPALAEMAFAGHVGLDVDLLPLAGPRAAQELVDEVLLLAVGTVDDRGADHEAAPDLGQALAGLPDPASLYQ